MNLKFGNHRIENDPLTLLGGVLRRRKKILFLVLIAGGLLTAYYYKSTPKLYQSTARVLLHSENFEREWVEQSLDSLEVALTSRSLHMDTIERFDLYPQLRGSVSWEFLLDAFRNNLDLQATPGSVAISFRYADPTTARKVADYLAGAVLSHYYTRLNLMDQQAEELDGFLADYRKRLEAQEKKLFAFREKHRDVLVPFMAGEEASVIELREELDQINQNLAEARQNRAQIVARPGNMPQLPEEEEVAQIKARLDALRMSVTENYPDIAILERQLVAAQARAKDARRLWLEEHRDDVTAEGAGFESEQELRARRDAIIRRISFLQTLQIEGPAVQEEYAKLTRGREQLAATFGELQQQRQQLEVDRKVEERRMAQLVALVDPASMPSRPVAPVRNQVLGVGLAISLTLSLLVALGLEATRQTFELPHEVRAYSQLPVLANVTLRPSGTLPPLD